MGFLKIIVRDRFCIAIPHRVFALFLFLYVLLVFFFSYRLALSDSFINRIPEYSLSSMLLGASVHGVRSYRESAGS